MRTRVETLGPLEMAVVEVILERGESATCDVVDHLQKPLAYTTVMTTLGRLYKKRLLERRMNRRAFYYSASPGLSVEALRLPDVAESWIARTYTGEIKLITNAHQ
jgi:predicted transcriptional regulator